MMNAISDRMIYIGIYLPGQHAPTTAAIMKLQRANNAETGSFAYGLGYLEKPQAIAFHPDHFPLQRHEFSLEARLVRDGGAMPLVVKDALPDAWGRLVISQELGGRIPPDDELLLLTNDDRVGAMIFSETRNMPAPVQPPRFEIADLAEAVKRLQYDMDLPKPLQRLLKRGGSLGGARPKTSFVHDHALWLAKFPAKDDPIDVQTLEAGTLFLAQRCGIRIPQVLTIAIGNGESAFLSKRFDRIGPITDQRRVHFLSASALLGIPYEASGGSYVEFARALRRLSAAPGDDIKELFRRMVFNILVDNSDDHLKNHGVLYMGNGRFRLSPAFDLVPQLTNIGYLMLSIDGESQEAHLERAKLASPHFGLSVEEGARIIGEMTDQVYRFWRTVFEAAGADVALRKRVESCFRRQAELVGAPACYR